MSQTAISTWESGVSSPTLQFRQSIERIFGKYEEEEPHEAFGEWLRRSRERKSLTQAELADRSGVSQITISFIETGRTTSPREGTVKLLTRVLGEPTKEVAEELEEEREIEGIGDFLGPFPIDEWEESAGPVPGVYVLYDSISRPVRIGQTKDMKRRMKEYKDNYWWFRPPTVVSFAYVTVPDEITRNVIEKTIIKFMGAHVIFNRRDTL